MFFGVFGGWGKMIKGKVGEVRVRIEVNLGILFFCFGRKDGRGVLVLDLGELDMNFVFMCKREVSTFLCNSRVFFVGLLCGVSRYSDSV